jgi:broad specificity phosphatase PhoE
MTTQQWPDRLWIVRHGESAGNVARDAAYASGLAVIDIAERDVDVPLSALGERQARALGEWFAAQPDDEQPTAVLTSPYLRARETATALRDAGGVAHDAPTVIDERLREKEFGVLDRLTKVGIEQRFPDQAALRARIGKFYFRPPGGESWCDVILRLRSVLDTITREHRRERVLIVGHQVTVNCLRYLFERMSEDEILDVDRRADVPNCSVTSYTFDPKAGRNGKLVLDLVNFGAPLTDAGTPVTSAPDVPAAPKS